jgi:hypothetical protein
MPSLRELQTGFRRALLDGDGTDLGLEIVGDGLAAEARLAIYRHHVLASLTDVLASAYPVVGRLVDRRFFAYAADAFIRRHPPAGPCLFEYGAALPEFLAEFPPCRHLAYLPDVARLEWAMNVAAHAEDAVALTPAVLSDLDPARAGDLTFDFEPSLSLVSSPWPIDRIWRANQAGGDAIVDLDAGGVDLEVRRRRDDVVFREVDRPTCEFRRALLGGDRLATAAERALAVDAEFDLGTALGALVRDGVLTAITPSPAAGESAG